VLKKSSSFILASLRSSTYSKEYASPLRSLRPRWTAFLNTLTDHPQLIAVSPFPAHSKVSLPAS
jgi:hypothetical protein